MLRTTSHVKCEPVNMPVISFYELFNFKSLRFGCNLFSPFPKYSRHHRNVGLMSSSGCCLAVHQHIPIGAWFNNLILVATSFSPGVTLLCTPIVAICCLRCCSLDILWKNIEPSESLVMCLCFVSPTGSELCFRVLMYFCFRMLPTQHP